MGVKRGVAACLAALAAVALARQDGRRAAKLFGASEALSRLIRVQILPYDREQYTSNVAILKQQLDQAAFRAAWESGSAMHYEQAVAYALL